MPSISYFRVDAFVGPGLRGNPAGVAPLHWWLDDAQMQAIARENALSETAFFVRRPDEGHVYDLRWFTPACEVDLCGHATLASAHVIFESGQKRDEIEFVTKSGLLRVRRCDQDLLELDFPAFPPEPCAAPPAGLAAALGREPCEVLGGRAWLAVFPRESDVRELSPDMAALAALRKRVIATAPGDGSGADFVSRFFAPDAGVPEDPVTGSAHCTLTPFWAERLGRARLRALQVSARGGELFCENAANDRVGIAGRARVYSAGEIFLSGVPS